MPFELPFFNTAVTMYIIFRQNILAYFFSLSLLVFTAFFIVPQNSHGAEQLPWVLVDTSELVVRVMDGEAIIAEYDNVSIGQRGTSDLHLRGDETTPLGEFRIVTIDPKSRYELFFGLDYPTARHAALALAEQRISEAGYQRLARAYAQKTAPPMNTALGGAIGIHGIGRGSLSVHNQYNWTNGCVALNNDQITDFATRVAIGTRVIIR